MADRDSGKNSLLSQVIEGLRQEPAYLLYFGLCMLFVFFGVGVGVHGVTSGQPLAQYLGFGGFVVALLAGFAVISRVETPRINTATGATLNVICDNWDSEKVYKTLKNAPPDATIRILQTWFPEENFVSRLEHLLISHNKRFSFEVLLLDSDGDGELQADLLSARVKLRKDASRTNAVEKINDAVKGLLELKRNVDAKWQEATPHGRRPPTLDIEVRLYNFLPFGPIYQIGNDVMYVGFFLNYATSSAGPMLEVQNSSDNPLWRCFKRNFDKGWKGYSRICFPSASSLDS